jgi:hypothetical protein
MKQAMTHDRSALRLDDRPGKWVEKDVKHEAKL